MASEKQLIEYEKQLEDYKRSLVNAQEKLDSQNSQLQQYQSNQLYGQGGKQNLVEWELDFKPELDDIARSLRCDVLVEDDKGNQFWTKNPDASKVFLNETGVNDVLRKIILLVNKNKVLSNYTIDEIRNRVYLIGNEIKGLIYTNYEMYGIDNEYKMNNFSSIVMDVLDIVESAYRRALQGETHKGLNEQRIVTQNDSLALQNQPQIKQPSQVKFYDPSTWMR